MLIKVGEKEYNLKFSYTSFLYMEDFNIKDLEKIEDNPFRMLGIVRQLMFGALNNNPKEVFKGEDIDIILETLMEEMNIVDLLTQLIKLLEESSFFKSLQRKTKKK